MKEHRRSGARRVTINNQTVVRCPSDLTRFRWLSSRDESLSHRYDSLAFTHGHFDVAETQFLMTTT
jgi:hypothetical protein